MLSFRWFVKVLQGKNLRSGYYKTEKREERDKFGSLANSPKPFTVLQARNYSTTGRKKR